MAPTMESQHTTRRRAAINASVLVLIAVTCVQIARMVQQKAQHLTNKSTPTPQLHALNATVGILVLIIVGLTVAVVNQMFTVCAGPDTHNQQGSPQTR